MKVEKADFIYLKGKIESTAGILSVQIDKLSSAGYISVEKGTSVKHPRAPCRMPQEGQEAFEEYVETLKTYLNL